MWSVPWATRGGARSTWSCSTRPGPAPGRRVVEAIAARRPRAVAYVACDPAALARDVRTFRDAAVGGSSDLRAFDLFPQTHHVECVALLTPTEARVVKVA